MGAFAAAGAWPGVLRELLAGHSLSAEVTRGALEQILTGEATDAQIAAFIVSLRQKGETPEEVVGLVEAMLANAAPLELPDPAHTVDVVGTGGSTALAGRAFNVSTMAAIVAAAAGATVCKHGNRKASSASGSTDLLEALGVAVELDGPGVAECVSQTGVGFAFARSFHPAMRHVAPVRLELGVPTVFNVLGPLSHPGHVGRQVLGVADRRLLELIPEVLQLRGTRAWVVHGSDGLDELTVTGPSTVIEVSESGLRRFELLPSDAGLDQATLEQIAVGDPAENATATRAMLDGEPGPIRDMVVLNASAALVVSDLASDISEGALIAAAAIDDGRAKSVLEQLVTVSQRAAS